MTTFHGKKEQYLFLVAFIINCSMFVYGLIVSLICPSGVTVALSTGQRITYFFAFFSVQSQVIFCFIFGFLLFAKYFPKISFDVQFSLKLSAVTFVTISGIFFWCSLIFEGNLFHQNNIYWAVSTVWLHFGLPVLAITVFCLTISEHYYDIRQHHLQSLWVITSYLFCYLAIILILGYSHHVHHWPPKTCFPYFFLNFYQKNVFYIALCITIFLGTLMVLQYIFAYLNNWILLHRYHNLKRDYHDVMVAKYHELTATNPQLDQRLRRGLWLMVIFAVAEIVVMVILLILNQVIEHALRIYDLKPATQVLFYSFTVLVVLINTFILGFALLALKKHRYYAQNVVVGLAMIVAPLNWFTVVGWILSLAGALMILTSEPEELHQFRIMTVNKVVQQHAEIF